MLDIHLKTIPHNKQRYETCGDWTVKDNELSKIIVSDIENSDYEFLIAVHELIEAYLCVKNGVKQAIVDEFDTEYESARESGLNAKCGCKPTSDSEPGDDKHAPYRQYHQFATHIEKKLAKKLGVNWKSYEYKVLEL